MKTIITLFATVLAIQTAHASQEILESNYGDQTIRLITNADGCYDTAPFEGNLLVPSITSSIEKIKICKNDKLMIFSAETGDLVQIAVPQQILVKYTFNFVGATSEIEYSFANGLKATSYSHIMGHTKPGLCSTKKDVRVCIGQIMISKQYGPVEVIGLTELGTAIIADQKGVIRLLGGAKLSGANKNRWSELYHATDFEN